MQNAKVPDQLCASPALSPQRDFKDSTALGGRGGLEEGSRAPPPPGRCLRASAEAMDDNRRGNAVTHQNVFIGRASWSSDQAPQEKAGFRSGDREPHLPPHEHCSDAGGRRHHPDIAGDLLPSIMPCGLNSIQPPICVPVPHLVPQEEHEGHKEVDDLEEHEQQLEKPTGDRPSGASQCRHALVVVGLGSGVNHAPPNGADDSQGSRRPSPPGLHGMQGQARMVAWMHGRIMIAHHYCRHHNDHRLATTAHCCRHHNDHYHCQYCHYAFLLACLPVYLLAAYLFTSLAPTGAPSKCNRSLVKNMNRKFGDQATRHKRNLPPQPMNLLTTPPARFLERLTCGTDRAS